MSHFKMIQQGFFGESLYYECSIYIWTDKHKILSLFICLRSTGFPLCIFTSTLSSSKNFRFNFRGNFLHTSVHTSLHRAHMQRFGTENPHDITYMLFLLPQEASDCVNSSPQCFTPALTWLHRHIFQTPSGGKNHNYRSAARTPQDLWQEPGTFQY